jgi:uncharacterized protein YlxW (UPF0749 family)
MADIGGEAGAGFAAKAGSAIGAGALWGIFASAFLLIPAIFGSLLGPILKRVTTSVNTKVSTIGNSNEEEEEDSKPQVKMSKAERDYQKKLAELEAEKEEIDLEARLNKVRARQAGRAKASRQATRPASI